MASCRFKCSGKEIKPTNTANSFRGAPTWRHAVSGARIPWPRTTAEAVYNDGTCEYVTASEGCTDDLARNYDAEATIDDGSCEYAEEFFDCDGNCLADVDCNGTCGGDATEDALAFVGGDCAADADADGVCDDEDECVGALDECGVCNGPGAVFECGCSELPEGDCDCDGSQQDALGECGGGCFADADGDGICDDEDDCVGSLDALGVCNGDCEGRRRRQRDL